MPTTPICKKIPTSGRLKESDAYPGHGRTWLWVGETDVRDVLPGVLARARHEDVDRAVPQCLRPTGTWDGGREKAPAAICRKVIEAKDTGRARIEIWGDGEQTRSFMYIDDCTQGIDQIMHCEDLIATPINLGSSELVSINELVDLAEEIGGVKLEREHELDAPQGVAGRNSDNTMIKQILVGSRTPFVTAWPRPTPGSSSSINDRKAGKRTVS